MTNVNIGTGSSQLKMPGLDQFNITNQSPSCCTLEPGVHVQYIGKINGGPKYGSSGIVKKALHQRAVVDGDTPDRGSCVISGLVCPR